MVHLIEPTHSARFFALMTKHCPVWQARAELNELPLAAEVWEGRILPRACLTAGRIGGAALGRARLAKGALSSPSNRL